MDKNAYALSRTIVVQVGDTTHTKINDLGVFPCMHEAMEAAELNYCIYTGNDDGVEFCNPNKWNVEESPDGKETVITAREDDGSICEYCIKYVGENKSRKEKVLGAVKHPAVKWTARVALACGAGFAAYKVAGKVRKTR